MRAVKSMILAISLAAAPPAAFAGGAVAGATEPTQIANNIQLLLSYMEQAQQTITQANQYASMLKNLQQLTPSSALDVAALKLWQNQNMNQTFKDLYRVVDGGQRIAYTSRNLDAQLKNMSPGYGNALESLDLQAAYRSWSDTTRDITKKALEWTAMESEDMDTEADMVRELSNTAQTADGQMKALTAGNRIGVAMIGQMQKLRTLQMAQMQAQNMTALTGQARQEASDEVLKKTMGGRCSRMLTPDEARRGVSCK